MAYLQRWTTLTALSPQLLRRYVMPHKNQSNVKKQLFQSAGWFLRVLIFTGYSIELRRPYKSCDDLYGGDDFYGDDFYGPGMSLRGFAPQLWYFFIECYTHVGEWTLPPVATLPLTTRIYQSP